MIVNLPIDDDALDALVCAQLRRSIKSLQEDITDPKFCDDPKEDRKLIAAMKRVIRYYGGTTD